MVKTGAAFAEACEVAGEEPAGVADGDGEAGVVAAGLGLVAVG